MTKTVVSRLVGSVVLIGLIIPAFAQNYTRSIVELTPPTSKQDTVKNIEQSNGECVWYQAAAATGASVADNAMYTVTVTTPPENTECAPGAWIIVGVPRASAASGAAPFSTDCPFQNPAASKAWMKDLSVTEEYCMTQAEEIWFGFNNNCSNTPLKATIRVSMSNFCDEDKKTFFATLVWVLIGGVLCCCCCVVVVCYKLINKRHEEQNAAAMGLSVNIGGGYSMRDRDQGQYMQGEPGKFGSMGDESLMAIRVGVRPNSSGGKMSTKDWEAEQKKNEQAYEEGDEGNRVKAMRWERKREEKRLRDMQDKTRQQEEEFEAWDRVAGHRQAESNSLDQKRAAAEAAERKASHAAKRSEDAMRDEQAARRASKEGGGDDSKLLKQAAVDIKQAVDEAYALPPNERKKKLRDLRMRWHPDKNPMLRELADEITKIINIEIERCKAIHGD